MYLKLLFSYIKLKRSVSLAETAHIFSIIPAGLALLAQQREAGRGGGARTINQSRRSALFSRGAPCNLCLTHSRVFSQHIHSHTGTQTHTHIEIRTLKS